MKRTVRSFEIVDCLGAPAGSGGMQLWASQVCKNWAAPKKQDVLFVIPRWLSPEFHDAEVRHLAWPNSNPLLRVVGQIIVVPIVCLAYRASALISLNSVVSPFVPTTNTTVICHDWRHLKNPHEFGIFQRLYRKYWLFSAKQAAHVVTISSKTFIETKKLTKRGDLHLVEPGLDHLVKIEEPGSEIGFLKDHSFAVTYGQHMSKRAEIAVEAFSRLDATFHLVVLSCRGAYGKGLRKIVNQHDLSSRVHLLGRVGDQSYSWLLQNCIAVLLLSSDEGYGIPAGEAIALGKPVIVAADSGMREIFGDQPIYVWPDSSAVANLFANISNFETRPSPASRSWAEVTQKLQGISRKI